MIPSLAKEGVSVAAVWQRRPACLQELSQSVAAIERLDHVADRVARRRACPRVPASPKMYPSRTREASKSRHGRQHYKPICRAFMQSPLTDSNRRPPPYHGGCAPLLRAWETRLVAGFPCNSGWFLRSQPLSSRGPEPPRQPRNLSPEPSPTGPAPLGRTDVPVGLARQEAGHSARVRSRPPPGTRMSRIRLARQPLGRPPPSQGSSPRA